MLYLAAMTTLLTQTIVFEFTLPVQHQRMMQALLQGEDGLGTVRCLDKQSGIQQLWTTATQSDEVEAWLQAYQSVFDINVIRHYVWDDNQSRET